MKLRNKKTGEIRDFGNLQVYAETENTDASQLLGNFDSFEQIIEYYEDYVPKEPLIKDEKIRKTVRAWADAIGVDDLFYCIDNRTRRAVLSWPGNDVAMELPAPIEGLATGRVYTTTELCGEERG